MHPARRSKMMRRLMMFCAIAGLAGGLSALPVIAQAPPVAVEPVRSLEEIQRDLNEAGQAMAEAVPSIESLYEPAQREKLAVKALPAMRRLTRLLDEYLRAEPRAALQIGRTSMEVRAWMAVLGDKQAEEELKRLTVSKEDDEAVGAKAWFVLVRWMQVRNNALAQEKLALELSALGKSRVDHPTIAQVAAVMTDTAATAALSEQAERIVSDDLKGPVAAGVAQTLAAKRKIKALENKPLVIEGLSHDGKKLTTADWKGKVILVDFWATWCPPCRAEMPELKKIYAEHHGKGLEILGISSDRDIDDLKGFLSQNTDITWPHLFDPNKPGMHPLAQQYGVLELPTMFLIDKKGVVRSVNAGESYKELIPKLLAE